MRTVDIGGLQFGGWTVRERADPRKWNCVCRCGTERAVLTNSLRSGKSTNCGCARRAYFASRRKHGKHGTKAYLAWVSMRQRCTNPEDASFKDYGGRGITVCARWLISYENFLSDMGEAPVGHSLDRIDNNGGYEPSNCRWATAKEQANNRRPPNCVRVAAAAYRSTNGLIVSLPSPARHHHILWRSPGLKESGFLLSDGTFADRSSAYKVAEAARQLKARAPGGYDGPELFTEDVW